MHTDYARFCEPTARKLWGEPNRLHSTKNDLRWGTNGSRSLNRRTGQWYDHELGEGGSTVELIQREMKCDQKEAFAWLEREGITRANGQSNGHSFRSGPPGTEVERYAYVDEAGDFLFDVVRYRDPKTFRQYGLGGIDIKGIRRVPYQLPALIQAVLQGREVFIPEGEKDCSNLMRLGLAATTNPMGAGKWRAEYGEHL